MSSSLASLLASATASTPTEGFVGNTGLGSSTIGSSTSVASNSSSSWSIGGALSSAGLGGFLPSSEPPPQDTSFFPSLSYTKRIVGFAVTLGLGVVLMFAALFFLINPRQFAKFYTLGSICMLASTLFLIGPMAQLKAMFHPSRIFSTGIYIVASFTTLYFALVQPAMILCLLSVIVQIGAQVWYGASYIPFAQSIIRSTASVIIPL